MAVICSIFELKWPFLSIRRACRESLLNVHQLKKMNTTELPWTTHLIQWISHRNYHQLKVYDSVVQVTLPLIGWKLRNIKDTCNFSRAFNQLHIDAATSDWSIAVLGCNVTGKVALTLRSVRKPPLSSNHNLCVKALFILNLFLPKEQLPCCRGCVASLPRDTEKSTVRLSGLVLGKKTYVSVVSFYVQCFPVREVITYFLL